jgi:hypothetical protein
MWWLVLLQATWVFFKIWGIYIPGILAAGEK